MQTDEEIGKVAAAVPVIICILWKFQGSAECYLFLHPRINDENFLSSNNKQVKIIVEFSFMILK